MYDDADRRRHRDERRQEQDDSITRSLTMRRDLLREPRR